MQVVTAEVYSKSLSNLVVYLLDKVRPDPTVASTNTVVAVAKLENYLRKNIFAAFQQQQPFSAHTLLESTVKRWLEQTRGELMEQMRIATAQGPVSYAMATPTPGCDLQDSILPALRNRLKVYEAIVTHLPLTATIVEKMITDVRLTFPLYAETCLGATVLPDHCLTRTYS
jgi:hypothetical protein